MIRSQRTIRTSVSCNGIGLHTGKPVRMTLKPAPMNTGVVFVRTDLADAEIHASAANTAATGYATTLCRGAASVRTVEHLLAALAGLAIDNVRVELDAEEVPIMDGSAQPFVKLIVDAGRAVQEAIQPMMKIIRPVFVREGDKQLAIWPAETTSISCFIDYDHPLLRQQSMQYRPSEDAFLREVSGARTFGFLSDVKALQASGLAQGASLDNAVALGERSVLNQGGLRYKDEFVRHKILDLVGDLSLTGLPIIGHIVAHKSGHGLNAQMTGKLLNNPQYWVILGSPVEDAVVQPALQYRHASL